MQQGNQNKQASSFLNSLSKHLASKEVPRNQNWEWMKEICNIMQMKTQGPAMRKHNVQQGRFLLRSTAVAWRHNGLQ